MSWLTAPMSEKFAKAVINIAVEDSPIPFKYCKDGISYAREVINSLEIEDAKYLIDTTLDLTSIGHGWSKRTSIFGKEVFFINIPLMTSNLVDALDTCETLLVCKRSEYDESARIHEAISNALFRMLTIGLQPAGKFELTTPKNAQVAAPQDIKTADDLADYVNHKAREKYFSSINGDLLFSIGYDVKTIVPYVMDLFTKEEK